MAAHEIGHMIELAEAGFTSFHPESGVQLAGFLRQLPELSEAFADALHGLAEWMGESGLSGEAGEHIAEAGVAAGAMKEAADGAWTRFQRENKFWLAGSDPEPGAFADELSELFDGGFIPDESDHLIEFLQRLPGLAETITTGLSQDAEWAAEHHLGSETASFLSDASMHAAMVKECADAAWGAFEDAHAFWLATR